ncbi:MAG: TlpA family protein disulfide reductase [Planctomycetota bacterium]
MSITLHRSYAIWFVLTLVLLGGAWVAGCGESSSGKPKAPQTVELEIVDGSGLQKVLDSQRGSVILLDVWATWCAPCVESWTKMLKLRDKYSDSGLSIVALSVDSPDKADVVTGFLQRNGVPGECLLLDVDKFDEFVDQTGDEWRGGVPTLLLYDEAGQLQYELIGADGAEDVEEKIRALLDSRR